MSLRHRILCHASWLALAVLPPVASGQTTAVVADTANSRALGTTATQSGTFVTIDGGTRAGTNLFHSFAQFSLGQGDTARWVRRAGDAGTLTNVISRVTGGQTSMISGTLDSTALPNASFFFINPAGIVFGAGARVNVPAVAHFSTAGELSFADGSRFAVSAPNGSTLSMAAPESFGFLGGQGSIDIRGAGASFAPTTIRLSFSGSNVQLSNSALNLGNRLVVGGLDLIGVGSGLDVVRLAEPLASAHSGAVTVRNTPVVLSSVDGPSGSLRIGGGLVSLSGTDVVSDAGGSARGGDIRIRADDLQITGASQLVSSARAAGAGGDVSLSGRRLSADGMRVVSVSTTAARGGAISLASTEILAIGGQSSLTSTNSGAGVGGDITLSAPELKFDGVFAISSTLGTGRGGNISVTAPSMQLFDANLIATAFGTAQPGNLRIDGSVIEISGGTYGSNPGAFGDSGAVSVTGSTRLSVLGAAFTASSASDNGAGAISLRSPEIYLTDTRIQADNSGNGGAGAVIVEAGTLVLDETIIRAEVNGAPGSRLGLIRLKATGDLQLFNSIITSNTNDRADGGIIEIFGRDVRLEDSRLQSDTLGRSSGDAGRVSVKAETLLIRNGFVTSSSNSTGDGGDVVLEAGTITLDTRAAVRSDATDAGNAGQVTIKTGSLTVLESSAITSRAQSGTGNAGTVTIDAETITMVDGRISSGTTTSGAAGRVTLRVGTLVLDSERRDLTVVSSETFGAGDAGDVVIDAKSVIVRNGAAISSDTFNDGNAGTIAIRADSLIVQDGGFISSDSTGAGDAGGVFINAGTLRVLGNGFDNTFISSDSLGTGNAGEVRIEAKAISIEQAGFISSDTYTLGDAGDISIKSDILVLKDFGNIRSRTLSNGAAGDILVSAGSVTLSNGGTISSEATDTSLGDAGSVGITADSLTLGTMALISTASQGAGDAGEVDVRVKTLTLDGGVVSTSSERGSLGGSGTLSIAAETLSVRNGGVITTISNNPRPAGQIQITAGSLSLDGARSLISSENLAGNPALGNPRGQVGDAGSVVIAADGLTVSNGGRISTNAFAGAAGQIVITIDRPGLLVLKGSGAPGIIQTSSGAGTGGEITISDPLAIISNGGAILALGQQRGANVILQSRYFINSADRLNTVAVDGDFRLETGIYDVSSGIVTREVSVLDASKVLRGQCPAARSSGAVSQLITRPVGPYVQMPGFVGSASSTASAGPGAGTCR